MESLFLSTVAGLVFAVGASPMLAASSIDHHASNSLKGDCDRACMAIIVDQVLASMVVHNPYTLPMAAIYQATENSHPAALGMMTAWRTVTEAGPPSLLAVDTTQGSAYFALDVSEGSDTERSILRGRVKVVNQEITELELFINRYRGDHGFSFSAAELPSNYEALMSPPGNRTKASRATLTALSEALFATSSNMSVRVDDNCQFTEIGWKVIDTGTYNNETTTPLSCSWPSDHPTDENARVGLVIDEELGFVVTSGMIQGKVYPYQNVSAFIPDAMTSSQETQDVWLNEVKALGVKGLLAPTEATGETLEVLQYYNNALQAMQINVYMSGPNMTSAWL
ncbi:hypothetical protein BO79DRAFT_161693 [Aspergillus costaricaensis CBS 115574]|uniref:Uncharacterized protein n=1 Tax=Aspergillus costaricaensis CBS 115574 TaxID=1448317 RepID=A0ACD1I034_9EURO|nr:hypothetical protein BO79DRAFT_161693 [Aspergillus costaricaensis CBS 115574]RAK83124.1 hypothetical protein BO79DRAFT_161693 [Aspergillus costaricaensis CBS 115574]